MIQSRNSCRKSVCIPLISAYCSWWWFILEAETLDIGVCIYTACTAGDDDLHMNHKRSNVFLPVVGTTFKRTITDPFQWVSTRLFRADMKWVAFRISFHPWFGKASSVFLQESFYFFRCYTNCPVPIISVNVIAMNFIPRANSRVLHWKSKWN